MCKVMCELQTYGSSAIIVEHMLVSTCHWLERERTSSIVLILNSDLFCFFFVVRQSGLFGDTPFCKLEFIRSLFFNKKILSAVLFNLNCELLKNKSVKLKAS